MGADDQAGVSNHITPEKVLDTAKWIKDGKIYKLGHNYDSAMPFFGKRTFQLRIPGGPFGENRLVYMTTSSPLRSGKWGPTSTASPTSAS
jgi:hypothetical protein